MGKHFFDYDDGDYVFSVSGNMAVDSDGDIMSRVSDHMAMDLDSGDIHYISSWPSEDEDEDEDEDDEDS